MRKRLGFALFLALCMVIVPPKTFAEDAGTWSTPIRLSNSGHAFQPLIKADPYGGVHVVWAEGSGEKGETPDTIYYSQLVDGTWTAPVDIVATISPMTLTPQSLKMDDLGNLVLLWRAGSDLMISSVPAPEAGSAQAWNTYAAAEVGVGGGLLQIDSDGIYHIMFVSPAQELIYISSSDHGFTWSQGTLVAQSENASSAIGEPYLAVDQSNNRYVAWSRHSEATNWGPAGVWFARSTDGGASWLSAREISPVSGHGWPDVYLDSQGRLRLTWIGNLASGGRYQVVSNDFGEMFGDMTVIATPDQMRGYAGRPQTVEDSSQWIHLVFAGLGSGAPDSIWYTNTSTSSEAWRPLVNLSPNSRDSQAPAADIGQGHLLHVVWTDYTEYNIYYSASDTGSPALAVLPLPTRSTQEIVVPQVPADVPPSPEATATRSAALDSTLQGSSSRSASSQSTVMILSLVPALLLVVAVVIISITRRKRQ